MSAALYVVPAPDAEGTGHGGHSPSALLGTPVETPAEGSNALVGPPPEDLAAHLQRYGNRPSARGAGAGALVEAIETVGLTGRGGAHFPAAIKWRGVLAAGGGGTVIANGAEGEPLAAKDAALLQLRPHLVLDGLVSAGEALGAVDLVVWLHDGAYATHRAVSQAIQERRLAGLTEPPIRIATGPDRYVTGESSAVMRALNGGPTLPELVRVLPVLSGVHGRPTLLHNAETLARVGVLSRVGAQDYQPTSLLSVLIGGRRRVVEIPATTTFAQALEQANAASPAAAPVAVLLGGYGGSWVRWETLAPLPVDQPTLRTHGLSLGASIVAPLPHGTCGLVETARIAQYLAASSARQCGPCLFGLPAVAELVWALADCDVGRSELRRLDRFMHEIAGRGACAHPDGAIRMVASALDVFADDVRAHRKGRCLAGRTLKVIPVPEVD
jgi:NADH:ubiquinone oxidoreductase subunit F (NADH-binding)